MMHALLRGHRRRRIGATLAVAGLSVAVFAAPSATAAENSPPCQVGTVNPATGAAYTFEGSTESNPIPLIFDADGDTNTTGDQTVVGSGNYGDPSLGLLTVTITGNYTGASNSFAYEVAFCLQGTGAAVQTGWLAGGATTSPAITYPASGYPTYAYVVREITTPNESGQWCSPGFWKNNYGAWAPTGYTPTSVDAVTGKTFGEILANPKMYASTGDYERIADVLSGAHPGISFDGTRIENCPLSADEAAKPGKSARK